MVLGFFGSFFMVCLAQLSKIIVTCPNSVEKNKIRVNFDLPKVNKMNINLELLKVSKMTSLKIYTSLVTEMLETSNLDIS